MNPKIQVSVALIFMLSLHSNATSADYDSRILVSVNHQPPPNSRLFRAAADCVRKIQRHWPTSARLVLAQRATVQEYDGDKILIVRGWVWHEGNRETVTHECMAIPERQTALNVRFEDSELIASRSGR